MFIAGITVKVEGPVIDGDEGGEIVIVDGLL